MGFADDYCRQIKRFRYGIFLGWFGMILLGLKFAGKFTEATTSQYTSSHDSDSAVAQRKASNHFPMTKDSQIFTIFLDLKEESQLTEKEFLDSVKDFQLGLYNEIHQKYGYTFNITGDPDAFLRSMSAYWLFEEYYGATELGESLVAPNGRSTIISVSYNFHMDKKTTKLADFLDNKSDELIKSTGLDSVATYGITGVHSFATAILDGVEDDLQIMDELVLPCALVILASIIRSLTLMIIPIINIVITILAEFTVMYPVALAMEVVSFTPSLMMSLTVAMSIDYSLFLLSRFVEELKVGRSVEDAIPLMIHGAGHTIMISGGTLIICFLGMLIFPLAMLQSVGIGASVTLFFALSINLTLTPAILYTFGTSLVAGQAWLERMVGCGGGETVPKNPKPSEATRTTSSGSYLQASLLSDEDIKQQERGDSEMTHERDIELKEFEADEAMSNGMWYAIANKLLEPRFGISVLVAVLCLCAPVCSFCLSVETSIDFDMTVPSDADTYDVFEDVEKQFGAGSVFPYRLLLIPKYDFCGKSNFCANPLVTECDAGLMCSDGLTAVNNVLESIAAAGEKHSAVSQFSGVTQLDGNEITYADYEAAFIAIAEGNPTSYQESIALLYASSCQTHTTVEGTTIVENLCWTTFTTIIIAESPFSEKGTEWLIKVRDEIDRLKKEDLFEIYLANGAGMTYDVTVAVYDAFPMIVIITLAVVFVLMAFAFESLVAPLRSVLTLALTLAFVYGLAVLVYQHGAFSFLNMRCLSDSGGISWLPPVMCFSIIVGLGLDYDVFLISRVYEFRANGYTDHSAAVKGICSTGFIITAAGMIMAVAFGGLFTSTELILNQTAFLLVFAVLLDTFVVRTLCVPALLGLTDHFSWWPGEMTPATKTIGF